jgi:adenine deaminase
MTTPPADRAAERLLAAEAAAGERAADLVLRGGRVVEVHSGRILPLDVAIAGSRIAAVGDVSRCTGAGTEVIDCRGRFVTPGFVEPHLHVGGSQLAIEGLAEVLLARGTVALATCFYEPAYIGGPDAVEELLGRGAETGLDVLLSPFHAAALGLGPFGDLGRFGLDDLQRLVEHPACVELREWNWHVARIPLPELQQIWAGAVERGVTIGGHLEGLRGPALQASVALGARSDHETAAADEAVEKVRAGVIVQIREGSGARDLEALVPAITEHGADPRCFAFSTDEQELASIVRHGHIDHKLRLAVARGVAPVDAVRMATLNAAASLGVDADYGAVAPGRVGSLVILDDLSSFRVSTVVARGRVVEDRGVATQSVRPRPYRREWRETVRVDRELTADDFALDTPASAELRVIGVTPGSLLTAELVERVEVDAGRLTQRETGLAKIAVIDRYEGGRTRFVGLIRGLGIEAGALATTFNPGVMNLAVVGVSEEDMAIAANRVVVLGGGTVVVRDGEVKAEVALPLFGFLSDAPVAEVVSACSAVDEALAGELRSPVEGLLTTIGFACLTVSIPELKICDRGLVRVRRDGQEAVALVVEATPAATGKEAVQ